nr:MAG TPA: hypothetical protein [Caudoviricetes sp.]
MRAYFFIVSGTLRSFIVPRFRKPYLYPYI